MPSTDDPGTQPVFRWSEYLKDSELFTEPSPSSAWIADYPELHLRPGILRNLWENDDASRMSSSEIRREVQLILSEPWEYDSADLVYLVSGLFFMRGNVFAQEALNVIDPVVDETLRELENFASRSKYSNNRPNPPLENVVWNPITGDVHVVEDSEPLPELIGADLVEEALLTSSSLKILSAKRRS